MKTHFKNIHSIAVHKGIINNILLLQDGRLASCSYDNTIQIFNMTTYKSEIAIDCHYCVKYICLLPNGNLVSILDNKTLNIYHISEKIIGYPLFN